MKRPSQCQTRRRNSKNANDPARRPIATGQRQDKRKATPTWNCHQCVFCISNVMLWARTILSGFPVTGLCANHAETPGQIRPVPSRPCRNFRPRPRRVEPPEPPNDNIRYIPLTRGLHAIVDAEDYKWLSQYKWYAHPDTRIKTFYARRHSHGRTMLMHRMIMQPPKGMVIDHINGNGLDNRRCNLRVCTQEQNARNNAPKANAASRFKGVFPCGDKWGAKVTHRKRTHRLGVFDDEVEAAKARDRLALELHGPFARLNFPPEDPPED
jgi:hypothetical protein